MHKQIACVVALMALTLGVGIFAGARQSMHSPGVDMILEQARQRAMTDNEEMPVLRGKPQVTLHYPQSNPAADHPILRWSRVDGAVMYDVQILKKDGDSDAGTTAYEPFMEDQRAYATGLELKLPDTFFGPVFYWRVRGLDLKGRPVSEFSDIEETYVDIFKSVREKPIPLSFFNQGPGQWLLYPVYDWIAVPGAKSYEVEVLDGAPENPNGTRPSIHRIDVYHPEYSQQYDQKARWGDKTFYWRVRALDEDGKAIGGYSDAVPFELSPKTEAGEVAIFGDSISHGGGSVSYSPTDWEFSYASYLNFPTINLSQSGDTSAMAAERFEKDVLPFKPSYVLILVGSNSLRAGVPSWEVIGDLRSIKKQALENGIKPVFLTIPPLNPENIKAAFDQDTTDDWRRSIAEVNDYIDTQVHIDIVPGMADEDGELKTELALDGLHLDPPGKELMAQAINNVWDDITALPDSAWE